MKIERQQLIDRIHYRIHNSLDLIEIINYCIRELRILSQCDRTLLYEFQADWSGKVIAESVGENISASLGNVITDSCFQSQAQVIYPQQFPIVVDNIYLTKYTECHLKLLEQYQVKANLVLPIYLEKKLWGLLIGHQCQDYRHWQLEDIDLFQEVSKQIQNIITTEITKQKSTETQLRETRDINLWIAQINSRFVNVTSDNFEIEVNQTLKFIGEKVNSERLCIFFFDENNETMYMKHGWTSVDSQVACEKVMPCDMFSWSNSLLKQGKSCLIPNIDQLPPSAQKEVENWSKMNAQSLFFNPLIWQNQVIGFIGTCSSKKNHHWTENQLKLIGIIGQTILNSHFRIQQEKELRLSSNRLQKAQKMAKLGYWEYDFQKGNVLYWSEEVYQIFEVDHQEFIPTYEKFLAIIHPDDRNYIDQYYWQHVHQKLPYDIIHRLQMPDGRIKYLHEQCETEYAEDGKPLYSRGMCQDITALKETELELQKLNQKLESEVVKRTNELQKVSSLQQAILNSTEYAIISIDTKGVIQTFNEGAEKIFGYTAEELIKTATYDILVDEQTVQDLALSLSQELGREVKPSLEVFTIKSTLGMLNDFKVTCLRRDGSRFPLLASVNPLKNETGEIVGFVGVCKDITAGEKIEQERKQAEAQLKASEARFRGVFESDIVGFLFTNSSGQIFDANDHFLEMIGYTRAELEAGLINWASLTPPEYRQQDLDAVAHLQHNSSIQPWEKAYYHKDGHLVYILLGVVKISEDNYVCIIIDISQRKQKEEIINRQLAAIEASINGIGILQNGKYIYANKAHHEIFGYQQRELIGKTWQDLYPSEEILYLEKEVLPLIKVKKGWKGEIKGKRKNGSLFDQGLSFSITDDGLIISISQDITQKKQQEIELQKTNAELARATRLKDEFLASMSHELRTPLNAILGMTEVLSEGIFGNINDRQKKSLTSIEKSGTHLLRLINDILDIAKIESGKLELELIPTSITLLCSSSVAFIKQQALKKGIQLETKLPQSLPKVFIDENRMRQVLINLLTNAVKFTPEGGKITLEMGFYPNYTDYSSFAPIHWIPYKAELTPDLSLSAEYLSPPYYLFMSIIDTGIGIDEENMNKLFQPFIQIDSALNRQYSGTGLGLVLVQRIVQLHGGQVGLCSVKGQGTNFIVALPCLEIPQSFSKAVTTEQNQSTVTINSDKQIVILLAEDDCENISTTTNYLEAKGYQLIVAKNGEEAIFLAKEEKPDLIIMDVQMPKVDGLTAIKEIRLNPDLAQTPIIAFTALAMENDEKRCLEAGANKYLAKPIPLKQLTVTIQEILSQL